MPTLFPIDICTEKGCEKPHRARGWCNMHYHRYLRKGAFITTPQVNKRRKDGEPGSRSKNDRGYIRVYLPEHPNAHSEGMVREHVLIMSEKLHRPLYPDEEVHHRNGIRDDNCPENLELRVGPHPTGITIPDAIQWANEILNRYTPTNLKE